MKRLALTLMTTLLIGERISPAMAVESKEQAAIAVAETSNLRTRHRLFFHAKKQLAFKDASQTDKQSSVPQPTATKYSGYGTEMFPFSPY